MAIMSAKTAEPPSDTKGSGRPVMGMMPIVMPMFTKDWNANQIAMPEAISMPNRSSARAAMRNARTITMPSRTTMVIVPTKPSSSPATVKMKSVCWDGTRCPR